MLSSPFPTLFICLFYGYFAKTLGPRLMENRKPFQLRKVLIVYNAIQTMFSAWIFYEVSIDCQSRTFFVDRRILLAKLCDRNFVILKL